MQSGFDSLNVSAELLINSLETLRDDFVRIVDEAAAQARHPCPQASAALSPTMHAFPIEGSLVVMKVGLRKDNMLWFVVQLLVLFYHFCFYQFFEGKVGIRNEIKNQLYMTLVIQMFRGSTYTIETDKDFSLNGVSLPEESVRIALVGVSDVGKSSIINCIEQDKFSEDIPNTNGFQLRFKKLKLNNYIINLSVWDGAGDRMLQFIQDGQFKKVDGIMYVCDLTDPQSVSQLDNFHFQITKMHGSGLVSILVGNKVDIAVSKSTSTETSKESHQAQFLCQKFANRNKMLFIKMSAKENHFVTDSFVELITLILSAKHNLSISKVFHPKDQDQPPEIEEKPGCHFCGMKCNLI